MIDGAGILVHFDPGDRVMYLDNGNVGTVLSQYGADVSVYFDNNIGGHTLNGRCPDGHGWHCLSTHLALVATTHENDFDACSEDALIEFVTS